MANQELALEHRVIQPLKALALPGPWILALSGGVDSMVLAEILRRWRRALKVQFYVVHVHHGHGESPAQNRFRDKAQALVRTWSAEHGFDFLSNAPEKLDLSSEAQLRSYRLEHMWQHANVVKASHIVFAHHRDDLLETRLLRLIRGTGPQGLRAMSLRTGSKLRPLLECSRAEIEAYAQARELKWIEDPSNQQTKALRNWLRQSWLPQLEQRQQGATVALARSLENMAHSRRVKTPLVGLRRKTMKKASFREQEQLVAAYLHGLGLRNYGQSHVREILKRIDSPRKNLTFEMLGVVFQVTPDLLWASRV